MANVSDNGYQLTTGGDFRFLSLRESIRCAAQILSNRNM